ncbi:MAG: LemA family protein [Chromatiales bacterium]|jgi:LemA protein
MTELTDQERIERMLAQGKLTTDEAERLRGVLSARDEHEAPLRRAARPARERRRLWLLLGFLAAFFVLGAATHWLLSAGVGGTGVPVAQTSEADVPEGRLIDLSGLTEERTQTMNRSLPLSLGILSVGVVAVLAALVAILYNGLVGAREQVNAGWAQVENVYQRRLDLVPLLVDAVQTYTEHERETLTELTRARADAIQVTGTLGSDTPQTVEQIKALEASQGRVESALARLFAVVENYPDLKASRNFVRLQDQIEGTENRLAIERRNYNELSRRYNTRLQTFPSNIIADMMAFESKPYFEAESKALKTLDDPFGRRGG